jgi:hypothetical protein
MADSPNIKRPLTVDCGMVDFLDHDRRSNSVLPSRFGQSVKPPRRPNFSQNMHPNKRCRRSLARPHRTTPEYLDVNHDVAVGMPRRFGVIEPIAFVGGMGGWCCRTWCVVVFVVVVLAAGWTKNTVVFLGGKTCCAFDCTHLMLDTAIEEIKG